jgi:hypothetical protein
MYENGFAANVEACELFGVDRSALPVRRTHDHGV